MKNPFRDSFLAKFLLGVYAAMSFTLWLAGTLVPSRFAIGAVAFLLLSAFLAWVERVGQRANRSMADARERIHTEAMLYRALRDRAWLDNAGNISLLSPETAPEPPARTPNERERFERIIARWAEHDLSMAELAREKAAQSRAVA